MSVTSLAPHPVTGHPLAWARDLALLGGGSSAALSLLLVGMVPVGFAPAVAVTAGLSGAALGLAMPTLLDAARGRVPLWLLAAAAPAVGGLWGGLAGAAAGLVVGGTAPALGAVAGAVAGAGQLGWFWFPYTFQTVRGGRTWPLLALAAVALPVVAWATVLVTILCLGAFGGVAGLGL